MILKEIKRRPTAFVVTCLLVIIGISLGQWQLRRAAYKESLAAQIEAKEKSTPLQLGSELLTIDQVEFHPLTATGHYIKDKAIWLDNRPHPRGRDPKTGITTGFILMMPFVLKNQPNTVIWVNRGWAPRDFQDLKKVPDIKTPDGEVLISGVGFRDAGKTYQLGSRAEMAATDGSVIAEDFELIRYEPQFPRQQAFVLRQGDRQINDGLDRDWPRMDSGADKHYGYAFQWFALSLMSIIFWFVTALRARTKSLR